MKNFRFRLIAIAAFLIFSISPVHAQMNGSIDEELFKGLHGHGSLNVVFAVIAIILAGLFITLIRIERKVSRLEKEIKK